MCGVTRASYRFGKDNELLPNWETWIKERSIFMLCFSCSREQWCKLFAHQNIGVVIELITHNGIAENGAHTWHAVLTDWKFRDSGYGVWRAMRQPHHYCSRVKFEKVIASQQTK